MTGPRPDYGETRETLRWRVALVLVALMSTLMLALGLLNTSMGFADTARLAWIVFTLNATSLAGLLLLPRRIGATAFFTVILGLIVFALAYGWWHGRPLHYWGFLFPPVVVFLLPAWRAMLAMVAFGLVASAVTATQLPAIDVVRFASVYGLLACFVTTYALLEERAGQMLRALGERDALTGCFNRRCFNEAMATLAQAPPAVRPGLLLLDIDHFKAINDGAGHLEGDRVLAAVAAILARTLPGPGARLYRYGGEEFAVLAEGRGPKELRLLGEALRAAVASGGEGIEAGVVSVSVGYAHWQEGEPPEAVVARADAALYHAKREGRDRVAGAEG